MGVADGGVVAEDQLVEDAGKVKAIIFYDWETL